MFDKQYLALLLFAIQPISMCKSRTDFDVIMGRLQNQPYFLGLDCIYVLYHHKLCKNNGLCCCNKHPGYNLDFATGPL